MQRIANPSTVKTLRGFESLTLRQKLTKINYLGGIWGRAECYNKPGNNAVSALCQQAPQLAAPRPHGCHSAAQFVGYRL